MEGAIAGEITVCFMDDKQIRELNLLYLGCDSPTDVISFNNSADNEKLSADIAISTDTALRNARIFKTKPQDEIYLYVIHGVLHLLGYNDNNKKNKLIMQKKEEFLWPSIKPKP